MDESVFAAQMLGMATVMKGHKATDTDWPTVMEIYWSKFKRWPNDRFIQAVSRCVETSAFFPTPAEVIEAGRLHPIADRPMPASALLSAPAEETAEDKAARLEAMAAFRQFVASVS